MNFIEMSVHISIYIVFISFQRLESFDFKASVGDGDDENAEKRWGVAGLLYGLGVPHLSRHSVVLNASGKVLEEEQIKGEPCSANLITWEFENELGNLDTRCNN